MPTDTEISIDVRNLFSVRVVKFDVKAGPPQHVDVSFEIQADKTRATTIVSVPYGKFPNAELVPGSGVLMDATRTGGELKAYDVVKQSAWDVVLNTTDTNKASGSGTHADLSWTDIKLWTLQETTKPSASQTVNTL